MSCPAAKRAPSFFCLLRGCEGRELTPVLGCPGQQVREGSEEATGAFRGARLKGKSEGEYFQLQEMHVGTGGETQWAGLEDL